MAYIRKNFIIGTLGPLVFREVRGKNIVSTKVAKGKIKHTPNTKTVSNTFGMASALGGYMMGCFEEPLNGCQDPLLFKRLTYQIQQVLLSCRNSKTRLYDFKSDSFSPLANLNFTVKSPLKSWMKSVPIIRLVDTRLSISLSRLDDPAKLVFPKGCFTCEIIASVALFQLEAGLQVTDAENQSLAVKRDLNDISSHTFAFQVPEGCFCVVSIFLSYYSMKRKYTTLLNTKKFNPSAICAAFIMPGKYANNDGRIWEDMNGLKFDQE